MINDASVVIGGGNWGIKEADVLGYKLINDEYYARDIDFANSTAAGTYTDSTGVIRRAPYNLLPQSNTFSNAAWAKIGATVTAGQTDPNGGTNASKIDLAAGGNNYIGQFSLGSGIKTNSVWLRADSAVQIGFHNGQTANGITLTTSWVRYTITQSGSVFAGIQLDNYFGVTTPQLALSFYAFQAQNETGDIATDYFPTTTRLNVPRIDYRNADGSLSTVGRLLLEPQRTNVALQSETITAATGTTVTLDTTTAPTGLNTADKLVEDTSTGLHFTSFGGVLGGTADSSIYCVSIFAKAAGRTRFVLFDNAQVAAGATNFDLSNGTVISGTGRIENYGNGWYRCTIFPAKSTSTTANVQIRMIDAGTNTSYTGDGTSGLFLWGKQIEPSATYQTTYIPTTTAAVTRNADTASRTGVESWIGQTEGTVFVDVNYQAVTGLSMFVSIRPNSANKIEIYRDGTTIFGDIFGNSVNVLLSRVSNPAGRYKIALAYKSGQTALYINGTSAGTSATAFSFATSMADLSINLRSGPTFIEQAFYNQVMLFPNRLTDSQLQSLTTL